MLFLRSMINVIIAFVKSKILPPPLDLLLVFIKISRVTFCLFLASPVNRSVKTALYGKYVVKQREAIFLAYVNHACERSQEIVLASQDKRKGNKYTIGRHSYLEEDEYSCETVDINGCHPKIFLDEITAGCVGSGGREEKTNKQEGRLFRSSLCTHISMQFSS